MRKLATLLLFFAWTAAAQNEITVFHGVATGKSEDPFAGQIAMRLSDTNGPGLSFGRFFSPHVAARVEAQLLRSEASFRLGGELLSEAGHLDLTPVIATAELHTNRDARFDLFAGAGYAYVFASDIDGGVLEEIDSRLDLDDLSTPVATAGLIWRIDARKHAVFSARWMPLELRANVADERVTMSVRSVMMSVGYRVRF